MQIKTKKVKGIRIWLAAVAAFMLITVLLTACSGDTESAESNANQAQTIKEGESLVISKDDISETAQFFPITVDGRGMEVLAVQAPDGSIRTAFNTCQVCNGSPKAYFVQSGNTLQCQNCGNKFPMNKVQVEAGGCNPVPLFDEDKTVTEGTITISYDTLKANVKLFPSNWKQ